MQVLQLPLGLLVMACALTHPGHAADWQWSVPVSVVISSETKEPPRAFLWIPPTCPRVRAVMVGQHNMLEEGIMEHPVLRKVMGELGMAAVWVSPAFDGNFRFDQGAGETFQTMMAALAVESGYQELARVPVVPIGHSAMASYPYHFAAWRPGRTLAAVSVKGTWPDYRDANSPPWKDSDLAGVPLLYIGGEYEDAQGRAGKAANFRARNPQCPLTMLADAGGGHFDYHDRMIEYLALYLRKAVQARLPEAQPEGEISLKPIDPTAQGWLVDRWRLNQPPTAAPAPVRQYAGDVRQAFWCFDGELARATEDYGVLARNKKAQLLGYLQEGALVGQNPRLHAQVDLKFHPLSDGVSFRLAGMFLDRVPEGRPVTWSGMPKDSLIGHATGGGPVVLERICGPVEKLDANTFAIRHYRMGMNNAKRSQEIWLLATHPGDGEYKRAVQQAVLHFPRRNEQGADQRITFPEIPDQPAGATALQLRATSDAGVPVYYYVRGGPAEVKGSTLTFTPVPVRAKYPVRVTVVAWQYGRTSEPKLRTAEPVERTFRIRQPAAR